MTDVSVTINFPTEALARLFMGWMSDGGGEDEFYNIAADECGVYTSMTYALDKWFCRVLITGLVVDDDDPEMNGIYDDEQE